MEGMAEIADLRDNKYLTEVELLKMNLHTEIVSGFNKSKEVDTLKLQLIDAQKALITYKMRDDAIRHESITQEHLTLLKKISNDNDISEDKTWGFNQETREIIINEKNI